jgi:tetratricopeptide (TPR) repeat protein
MAFVLASAAGASPDVVSRANALYQRTEYQESLHALEKDPAPDAASYALTGKNYFMLGDYKRAIEFLEKAQAGCPSCSEYPLWLGRSWGRRAEGSVSPLAVVYATRTRQYFEKALALDPHNHEASNDLFDFYLNAPAILGGGIDKAEAAAKSIAKERPPEYEFEEARLAEKKNDYAGAESHLRRAIELAPHEAGRIVDLARFLAHRGRPEESDKAFERASSVAPGKPGIAFAQAKADIEPHRNPERARRLLKEYLQASLTPDDPPRKEAEKLLERAGG